MRKTLFVPFLYLCASLTHAAVVGDFSHTSISSGYISTDPDSYFYKGISHSDYNFDGIERKSPSELLASYFSDERLDGSRIDNLIKESHELLIANRTSFCMNKFRSKVNNYFDCHRFATSDRTFQKKWKLNKYYLALSTAIEDLERFKQTAAGLTVQDINLKTNAASLSSFMQAIEIINGIQAENEQRGKYVPFIAAYKTVRALTDKNYITSHDRHASNLKTPESAENQFYSYSELKELKEQGTDLSMLDPYDSAAWRKPKKSISDIDTTNYDLQGVDQLRQVLSAEETTQLIDSASSIDVFYKGDNFSGGATPKFDAYFKDLKIKVKFITDRHGARAQVDEAHLAQKGFWGSEVNVEPVVNNIASALGFTIDPTYFKKTIRLYFEKASDESSFETQREDFISGLNKKYGMAKNVASAFSNIQKDASGRPYILVRGVTLEPKSDIKTDMNIGFFRRKALGKALKREHRALYLFYAFIADLDTKDDNSKVKIVPTKVGGKTKYKVALSSADMGAALGTGHPNFYNYKLIRSVNKNDGKLSLRLNHPRLHSYDLKYEVNIDDAKWFTRRLAQFSLEQFERSFKSAGFPDVVAKYYARLMSKRRNELVKALDMVGDQFLDDGGKQAEIKLIEEFTGSITGHEEFFKGGLLTDPEGKIFDAEIEPFTRFWGISLRKGTGDPLDSFMSELLSRFRVRGQDYLNNRVISQLSIDTNGLGFYDRGVFPRNFIKFCDGECFAHGLNIGYQGLVPIRYIMNNPNKNSDNPFILVDVFRSGFFIGKSTMDMVPDVDLIDGRIGGKLYLMKEYIRITEAQNFKDYYEKVKPLEISEKHLKDGFADQLHIDDKPYQLITSQYIGLEAPMKAYIAGTPMTLRLGVQNKVIKRTILDYQGDKVYLRYDKGNEFGLNASFNIFDFLYRIPLYEYNRKSTLMSSKVVQFSASKDRVEIQNCLKLNYNCETGEELVNRKIQKTSDHVDFNFFNLFGVKKSTEKQSRELNDITTDESHKDKLYIYRKGNYKYSSALGDIDDYISTAYINEQEELSVSIDVNFEKPQARRKHLKKFLDSYKMILPEDVVPYELKHVKYYLGMLNGKVSIHLDKKIMSDFFSRNFFDEELCESYGTYLEATDTADVCSGKKTESHFARKYAYFEAEYVKSYNAYVRLRNTDNIDDMKFRDLKILSKFFLDEHFKLQVVAFIIDQVAAENFKRDVEIYTELAAFPGKTYTVKESKNNKGKQKRFKVFDMEINGDQTIETVSPLFYSSFRGFDRIEF